MYLTRLENDLVELLEASVEGTLDKLKLEWNPAVSVCVVMASGGYPGNYAKGKAITDLTRRAITGYESVSRGHQMAVGGW